MSHTRQVVRYEALKQTNERRVDVIELIALLLRKSVNGSISFHSATVRSHEEGKKSKNIAYSAASFLYASVVPAC